MANSFVLASVLIKFIAHVTSLIGIEQAQAQVHCVNNYIESNLFSHYYSCI